jgi:hypothetical protein
MKLWICGQANVGNEWEWQGVFDSEDKAVAACRDKTYFIAEVELNEAQPHESCEFENARYPLA